DHRVPGPAQQERGRRAAPSADFMHICHFCKPFVSPAPHIYCMVVRAGVNGDHTVWVIPGWLPAIRIACTIHGRAWSRAATPVKTRADTLVHPQDQGLSPGRK